MTVPRNAELDLQIMLVERERISNMIDTVSRFGSECPVCAISQSLYEFRRNIGVPTGCETNCPAYRRCQTFIHSRRNFLDELGLMEFELKHAIYHAGGPQE